MKYSTKLSDTIHLLVFLYLAEGDRITSAKIAESVKTNPAYIRQLMSALKKGGLITSDRGQANAALTRNVDRITMLDIYRAVECIDHGELFHFHENPNTDCPVGRNIHKILDDKLERVQNAMERELASITLADVKKDTDKYAQSIAQNA